MEIMDVANAIDAANLAEVVVVAGAAGAADFARARSTTSMNSTEEPLLSPTVERSDGGGEKAGWLASLVRWAQKHPSLLKALTTVGELLSAALLWADLVSDVVLMADLLTAGFVVFGTCSALLIINQYAAMDKSVHAFVARHADATSSMVHLLVGFPLTPLALDLLLVLEPLGVFLLVPPPTLLEELFTQYKATRSITEVTIESGPQTILQLVLFVFFLLGGNAAVGGVEVPLSALLTSLTLSIISLTKAWLVARINADHLELSLPDYVSLLVSMGKGTLRRSIHGLRVRPTAPSPAHLHSPERVRCDRTLGRPAARAAAWQRDRSVLARRAATPVPRGRRARDCAAQGQHEPERP